MVCVIVYMIELRRVWICFQRSLRHAGSLASHNWWRWTIYLQIVPS